MERLRLSRVRIFALTLLFFGFSGCGGGGGGNDTPLILTPPIDSEEPVVEVPVVEDPVVDEPVVDDPTIHPVEGLDTGFFWRDQDPNLLSFLSEDQIQERLTTIQGCTKCIRTFGASDGLGEAPRLAKEMGFCVAAGAWLDKDFETNELEIERLIPIGVAGNADYLVVGSEALYRGELTEEQLISYVERVRTAVPGVPVTTGEIYQNWIDHPNLVAAVDVLFSNYYPYWEGVTIDSAIAALNVSHQQVVNLAQGRDVIVSETGWPSGGDTLGGAVPSPENAARYFMEFVTWAEANSTMYFYFEAFDEPWKANYEGPQGAFWGIWDTDGVLKPGMLPVFLGERSEDTWSRVDGIPGGAGGASVLFTFVPDRLTTDNLSGLALHVVPTGHAVVVYIRVSNEWWVKPFADSPLTNIAFDGSFITDITTGGIDSRADRIVAFLIPRTYSPPIALGWSTLPSELYANALAVADVTR